MWAPLSVGAAQELPAPQQATLLLRMLAYDRNVKTRAGSRVTIAVVSRDARCAAMAGALNNAAKGLTVGDLPVRAVEVAWSENGEGFLVAAEPTAIYVCGDLKDQLGQLLGAARRLSALSFSASAADVRAGVSIGLVAKGDKAGLLVNLPAAKAEGAELDAAVLRLAEIVRR